MNNTKNKIYKEMKFKKHFKGELFQKVPIEILITFN